MQPQVRFTKVQGLRNKQFLLKLHPEERQFLADLADSLGISSADFARNALQLAIDTGVYKSWKVKGKKSC